ncbi:hypothetical protein JCM33374_g4925 [Metschnikowia sp. JCM 33374]|nr:hypothetical protein JCM33374_g4925 [Metschnikowia sp. JCM 33374]
MGKSAGSVSQSVDQKVYDLLHDLLQEQTEKNKSEDPLDPDSLLHIALARDLRPSDLLAYVQARDLSLRRVKRVILEKSVDVVLRMCREDEEEELAEVIRMREQHALQKAAEADSDFEGVDGNNLMEVKDTNSLNKSLVSMWEKAQKDQAKEEAKTRTTMATIRPKTNWKIRKGRKNGPRRPKVWEK